jgi:hypothetical protein
MATAMGAGPVPGSVTDSSGRGGVGELDDNARQQSGRPRGLSVTSRGGIANVVVRGFQTAHFARTRCGIFLACVSPSHQAAKLIESIHRFRVVVAIYAYDAVRHSARAQSALDQIILTLVAGLNSNR